MYTPVVDVMTTCPLYFFMFVRQGQSFFFAVSFQTFMGRKKSTVSTADEEENILDKVRKIVNQPQGGAVPMSPTGDDVLEQNALKAVSAIGRSGSSLFGHESAVSFVAPGAPTGTFVVNSFAASSSNLGKALKEYASRVVMMLEVGVETGTSFAGTWESLLSVTCPEHLFDLRPLGSLFSLLFFHLAVAEQKYGDVNKKASVTRADQLSVPRNEIIKNLTANHVQKTLDQVNEKLNLLMRLKGPAQRSGSVASLPQPGSTSSHGDGTAENGHAHRDLRERADVAATTSRVAREAIDALATLDPDKLVAAEGKYDDVKKALGDLRQIAVKEALSATSGSGEGGMRRSHSGRFVGLPESPNGGSKDVPPIPRLPQPPATVNSGSESEGGTESKSGKRRRLRLKRAKAEVVPTTSSVSLSLPMKPYKSPSQIRKLHALPTVDDIDSELVVYDPRYPILSARGLAPPPVELLHPPATARVAADDIPEGMTWREYWHDIDRKKRIETNGGEEPTDYSARNIQDFGKRLQFLRSQVLGNNYGPKYSEPHRIMSTATNTKEVSSRVVVDQESARHQDP